MPEVKITGQRLTHIWDDNSESNYNIEAHEDEELGKKVDIGHGADIITIYEESWPQMKGIIDDFFKEVD